MLWVESWWWEVSGVAKVSYCEVLLNDDKTLCFWFNFDVARHPVLRKYHVVRCYWILRRICVTSYILMLRDINCCGSFMLEDIVGCWKNSGLWVETDAESHSVARVSCCEILLNVEKILYSGFHLDDGWHMVSRKFHVVRCYWMLRKVCVASCILMLQVIKIS